jgi:hypothetical protein
MVGPGLCTVQAVQNGALTAVPPTVFVYDASVATLSFTVGVQNINPLFAAPVGAQTVGGSFNASASASPSVR